MKRRSFLETVAAGSGVLQVPATAAGAGSARFTPVDLSRHFNASVRDYDTRERLPRIPPAQDGLIRTLTGEQRILGIPYRLGPDAVDQKSWIVCSTRSQAWTARTVEIPLGATAGFLCLVSFCDAEPSELASIGPEMEDRTGQPLAHAILVYEDGSERKIPIRRRFESNSPGGRPCFNAQRGVTWQGSSLTDPLARGTEWGRLQTAIRSLPQERFAFWTCALANPAPDKRLRALRLQAAGEDCLVVGGLTLFHGRQNPIRHERRAIYRITLPAPVGEEPDRWLAEIDLGFLCRTYALGEFDAGAWLQSDVAASGDPPRRLKGVQHLYVEATSSPEAVLTLTDKRSGEKSEFDLARLAPPRELEAKPAGARVEVLDRDRTWVHGRVVDGSTGRPTPVRLAFRSKDGRYLPPYGHCANINSAWFEDYSADLKLGDASYAYVDGAFQAELPVGEIFVELSKGFEYEVVRRRIEIAPGQRDLELRIARASDWRKKGWVTADTHVHFLSPSTAVLEGQAEGLNLVNLLAAQWGDLYTNVGDLSFGSLVSPDRETVVAVATENRQHMLGHLGLLGVHRDPVYPMSADGPNEAYLGDPLWSSMSEWAEECRKRRGVVIAVHFPNPNAEMAAEIVTGKIDAVELYPRSDGTFRSFGYNEWYRYLNCGYRVAAAGGTDKMNAATPVGGNRTYAYLAQQEFSFANWAAAVRAGRTFATTGPLIDFRVDGRMAGDEIALRAGGGTFEVQVEATSQVPFHRVEVVWNGAVVASREEGSGTRQMTLAEKVSVKGPGWLAARCASRLPTARFGVAAHTSPVYVTVPGLELFSHAAGAYLLKLIEGSQTYVENLAISGDPQRVARIVAALKAAHAQLHRRAQARQ